MLNEAYEPQCASVETHCADKRQLNRRTLTLLALALGTFCIGTAREHEYSAAEINSLIDIANSVAAFVEP